MSKIVILGAGISGLSLGWRLKNHNISILEKANRTGGWLETFEQEGFLFEQGPRSCRPAGAGIETLKLIQELNLEKNVIVGNQSAQKRYLYRNNKLELLSLKTILFEPCIWRGVWQDLIQSKSEKNDESIHEFFFRRFGKEIVERFIDPMASGIYAGNIHRLSMRSCFPAVWEMEKMYRSVICASIVKRGKRREDPFLQKMQKETLFSFKNGMRTLTEALTRNLQEKIQLNQEVASLTFCPDHVQIHLANGNRLKADHVYSTLPAESLASILSQNKPLSDRLLQFQNTSVAVVNLGYRKKLLKREGFGYLISSMEKEEILGVVWDSSVFPEQNRNHEETRLTVMIGGANMTQFERHSRDDFVRMGLRAVSNHLGIQDTPDTVAIKIAQDSIPQYQVGHHSQVREIEKILPKRMSLLGASFYGVSVNDCIAKALLHKLPQSLQAL